MKGRISRYQGLRYFPADIEISIFIGRDSPEI